MPEGLAMWITLGLMLYFLLIQRVERGIFGTSIMDIAWSCLWGALTDTASRTLAGPARVVEVGTPGIQSLPERDWLTLFNHQPDACPHLLIAGKTGSGKTTFARAVLSARTGYACVLNPKNNQADWQPLPYVTYDNDGSFTTMAATLTSLHREVIRRGNDEPTLTVILDDVSLIAQSGESKAAYLQFVRAAARMGRSKRVRLVVLAHETTAVAMGIPGEAGLLDNFTRIAVDKHHNATIISDAGEQPLTTRSVPSLAEQGVRGLHEWMVSVSGDGAIVEDDTDTDIAGIPDMNALSPHNERDELILLAIREGWSFNRLYRAIGGNRNAVSRRWQELQEQK